MWCSAWEAQPIAPVAEHDGSGQQALRINRRPHSPIPQACPPPLSHAQKCKHKKTPPPHNTHEVRIDNVEGLSEKRGPAVAAGAAARQQRHQHDVRVGQQVPERVQRLQHPAAHERRGGQRKEEEVGGGGGSPLSSHGTRKQADSLRIIAHSSTHERGPRHRSETAPLLPLADSWPLKQRRPHQHTHTYTHLSVTPGTARNSASSASRWSLASEAATPRSLVPINSTTTWGLLRVEGGWQGNGAAETQPQSGRAMASAIVFMQQSGSAATLHPTQFPPTHLPTHPPIHIHKLVWCATASPWRRRLKRCAATQCLTHPPTHAPWAGVPQVLRHCAAATAGALFGRRRWLAHRPGSDPSGCGTHRRCLHA